MGNSGSVSAGNKAQVDTNACEWYKLLNLHGEGEFAALTRKASQTRDFTELDAAIKEKIRPYLYNNGEGRYIPSSELIHVRRCYREGKPIRPPDFSHGHFTVKKSRFANILNKDPNTNNPIPLPSRPRIAPSVAKPPVKAARGKHKDFTKMSGESMRFVCWDIYQRGTVGETIMHACLLLGLPLYAILAKRLLLLFPKLLVDIYISDQYYGESVLHMAIVNEDPAMVKYLLDRDEWDLHNCRCVGSFFAAFDQSEARSDIQDSEMVQINLKTNYKGFVHYGEYALSFAACLNQEECIRLLLARGADCNSQDSNGNTALHMAVIHNQLDMFDLIYNVGASLKIKNRRGLTPLTLAAELGLLDMYSHILMKERRIKWTYGGTSCAEYPLCDLDTVSDEGQVNNKSALHLIVYGKEKSHLKMIDGTILTLLEEKWRSYVRYKYFMRFFLFTMYYLAFTLALWLRPTRIYIGTSTTVNGTQVSFTTNSSGVSVDNSSLTANSTQIYKCYLLSHPDGTYDMQCVVRFICELITVCGAVIYLISAGYEATLQGLKTFGESLQSEPASKGMFLFSCGMVILQVPGRVTCAYAYEDILAVLSVMCTCPYFLFFCRGFHAIGPFVLMIYKMIATDFIQFVASYTIFLISFSQAMYLAFRGYHGSEPSPFTSPLTAIFGLFYMSMGDFKKMYDSMQYTRHEYAAKVLFIVYMVIVTLILMNMLIAMMGNTYQLVRDSDKEYLRQWAQVILAIEHSVSKNDRLHSRYIYSEPMGDGRRALVVKWRQSELEKKDLQERRDRMKQEQKEQFVKRRREYMRKSTRNLIQRKISAIEEELYSTTDHDNLVHVN